MITKITDSNRSEYNLLFEKANSDLFNSEEYTIEFESVNASDFILGKTYYVVDANGPYKNANNTHFSAVEGLTEFEDDETYYQAPAPAIYDLNTFFQNLRTLTEIDKNYMRLPLDEPCFEILDSSTDGRRIIKVPEDFAKNGISVVGDEIAEIVYFKTNRYYENIDLIGPTSAEIQQNLILHPINIAIQWEKDGEKDVDMAIVDQTGIPFLDADNNIYFGWAIDSKLTKEAGEIKFSVIFYQMGDNGNKVAFSLNTQSATVKVNNGLSYEIEADKQFKIDNETITAHDSSFKVTGRIRNSTTRYATDEQQFSTAASFSVEGAEDIATLTEANTYNFYKIAGDAEIITGKTYYTKVSANYIPVAAPIKDDLSTYYEKVVYCKMDLDPTVLTNTNLPSLKKQGMAIASNGTVNYIWKNKNQLTDDDSYSTQGNLELNSEYSSLFKRVNYDTRILGVKYYKYEDGKYVLVTDLPKEEDNYNWRTSDKDNDGCIYYEKRSPKATISGPGCYWLIATNNEGVKLPSSTESTRIYVPGPTKIDVTSITNGNKYYAVDASVATQPLQPQFVSVDGDTLTYEWKDSNNSIIGTDEEYTFDSTTITDGFNKTYTFRVGSQRNNSAVVYSDPVTVFVSAKPQNFTYSPNDKVIIDKKDNTTNKLYTEDDLANVTIKMLQPKDNSGTIASDYILYNWYQAVPDRDGAIVYSNDIELIEYSETEKAGAYEITDLTTAIIPKEKLEDSDTIYKIKVDGKDRYFKAVKPTTTIKTDSIEFPDSDEVVLGFKTYYCDVINVFNGATSDVAHSPYTTIQQTM